MKITKTIISTFLLIFFFSCKDNKRQKVTETNNQSTQNNMGMGIDINKIKKHIEFQKRVETEEQEFDNAYDLNLEDLELVASIISEELKKNGYKNITDTEYQEKINSFFRINTNIKCKQYYINNEFITLFGVRMDGSYKTLVDNQYDLYFFTKNTFFSNRDHFLFNMFLLKNIIDIKTDNSYQLKVPQYIIARNKYVFNNSKSDFSWLQFNDSQFLESLVKKFGYVKDKELLKLVLDKNLKDAESFGQVIYIKDCSEKLVFHNEIIDLLNITTQENQKKYLEAIYNYFEYLRDTSGNSLDLTFSEKAEIQGKLAYYASKIAEKMSDGPYSYYSFFIFLSSEEYQEEFKKRNYYNIEDFKEVYEDTKAGGVTYPGMAE